MRTSLVVLAASVVSTGGLMISACTRLISPPERSGVKGSVIVKSDTLLPAEFPCEILVLEDDKPEGESRTIIYALKATTKVGFARSDGLARKASIEDIEVGSRVRAWSDGACNFGRPMVCGAAWILILDD